MRRRAGPAAALGAVSLLTLGGCLTHTVIEQARAPHPKSDWTDTIRRAALRGTTLYLQMATGDPTDPRYLSGSAIVRADALPSDAVPVPIHRMSLERVEEIREKVAEPMGAFSCS